MIKKLINILGPLALIIICINAFFIYPSADDYSYFVKQNSYGFWEFQKWHYLNWGGRYIPNIILGSFDFDGVGLYYYRAIAVIITLSLYFSLLVFIRKIQGKENAFFITNLAFLAYCFSLYSLSQEFYWMPGSITYTLSLILSLLSWYILDKTKNFGYFILSVILVVILNGTNEISMLFYNGSLILFLIFDYLKNKKFNFPVFALFIISFGCMLASILAPGNSVRTLSENNENTHDLIFSLSRAVFRTGTFTAERLFILLIFGIILIKELNASKFKIELTFIPKWVLKTACFIFPFAILCFGIFPSYYATGRIPPERTVNTIAFFFLISIIVSIGIYKANFNLNLKTSSSSALSYVPIALVLVIALYPNDLRSNIYDLFSGRSAQFEKEMTERDVYIKNNPNQDVVVKKISVLPNTLLFKDISNDPHTFFNYYYAKFYNKKTVTVNE